MKFTPRNNQRSEVRPEMRSVKAGTAVGMKRPVAVE
jgi:hypothetical protein